jgi:hypothetical protein
MLGLQLQQQEGKQWRGQEEEPQHHHQHHHQQHQHQQPHQQDDAEEQDEEQEEERHDYSNSPPLDWTQELTDFYLANDLEEKIPSIDAILEAWHGHEVDMMEVLHNKYGVDFDDRLRERLTLLSQ